MAANSIGVESRGTTITLDASSVGTLTGFSIPGDENKEYRVDGLGDPRECFKKSAQKVGQIANISIRHDAKATTLSINSEGEFVFTLPKQDSASTQQNTFTFDGYVLTASSIDGDLDDTDGLSQDYTVRLDSEIVEVLES